MSTESFEEPPLTFSVVLADDHPVYLDALSRAVDAAPELSLAGTATDGAEAIDVIQRVRPDVAVPDGEVPVYDGPAGASRPVAL